MADIIVTNNVATGTGTAGSNGRALTRSAEGHFSETPSVLKSIDGRILKRRLALSAAAVFALAVIVCSVQRSEADTNAAATTTAAANAALIADIYDAFGRGDMQTVFATLDENILWHVPGRGPLSHDYRGHAEVLAFFEHFTWLSAGSFRLRADEIVAKGDRVVVLCTETAQRAGRTWSSTNVHIWTVRDGRATAFTEYEGDQQTEDEFWSLPD
jgi:ketosteroid isomerase-like protein